MEDIKIECDYCDKVVDGSYVDRNMNFCNPECASKQAQFEISLHDRKVSNTLNDKEKQ